MDICPWFNLIFRRQKGWFRAEKIATWTIRGGFFGIPSLLVLKLGIWESSSQELLVFECSSSLHRVPSTGHLKQQLHWVTKSHIHIVVHAHVLHPESIDKGPPGPQLGSTFRNPLILAMRRISMDNPQGRLGSQAWAWPEARSSPEKEMVGIILRMIFPFSIELDKMKAFGSCDCKNPGTEIPCSFHPLRQIRDSVCGAVIQNKKRSIGFIPQVQPGRMHPCLRHILHIHNHCMSHLGNAQPPRNKMRSPLWC